MTSLGIQFMDTLAKARKAQAESKATEMQNELQSVRQQRRINQEKIENQIMDYWVGPNYNYDKKGYYTTSASNYAYYYSPAQEARNYHEHVRDKAKNTANIVNNSVSTVGKLVGDVAKAGASIVAKIK